MREMIQIEYGDITDVNFLMDLMHKEKPDEIYHLAAQSFVGYIFRMLYRRMMLILEAH